MPMPLTAAHSAAPEPQVPSWSVWLTALLLALGTFAAFYGALANGFVSFDDHIYVTRKPQVLAGLSWDGMHWAFASMRDSNWHPLTWLAHMLDVELYGLNPAGHHLSSVLVHCLNTALCFLALRALTGATWRSAAVALLFALHPLRVQSVAWISERKDVLAACFWLASMWAYAAYARKPGLLRYLAVAACMALGLMSKAMLVTLPFALLLLDYWPLGRARFAPTAEAGTPPRQGLPRLILEKIPLLAMALAAAMVAYAAQTRSGATEALGVVEPGLRAANALTSYFAYLGKTAWPVDLAILYPYPDAIPLWQSGGAAALLLLITAVCIVLRKRAPYLAVGWLWFVGTLVPVIGLVQIGVQSMADRYTYIPHIGLFLAVIWAVADLTRRIVQHRTARTGILALGTACVCLPLLLLTHAQVRVWKDSETLFRHSAETIPNHTRALYNLGGVLHTEGKYAEAADTLLRYLDLGGEPNQKSLSVLARSLEQVGEHEAAVSYGLEALRLDPKDTDCRLAVGLAMAALNHHAQALEQFQHVLAARPNDTDVMGHMAISLINLGHDADALRLVDTIRDLASRAKPGSPTAGAAENLTRMAAMVAAHAQSLITAGHPAQGTQELAIAARINPCGGRIRLALGQELLARGRVDEALWNLALAEDFIPPGSPDKAEFAAILTHAVEAVAVPRNTLLLDSTIRFFALSPERTPGIARLAVRLALAVLGFTPAPAPEHLDTLAMALAAAGQYPDAATTAARAAGMAQAMGQPELAATLAARRDLYLSGRPASDAIPPNALPAHKEGMVSAKICR